VEFIASIEPLMRRFFVLHARMQQFFKAWDRADPGVHAHGAASVIDVDFLRQLQAGLGDAMIDDGPLVRRLEANYALLETFARTWQAIAAEQVPALGRFVATSPAWEDQGLLDVSPLRVISPCSATLSGSRRTRA